MVSSSRFVYTHQSVAYLTYRPEFIHACFPITAELLLGDRNYGPPVDLWGAGCIMAEMWTRTPIMQGASELQQIVLISQLCGSITPEVWPGVENLDLFDKMELPKNHRRKVKDRLKYYVQNSHACNLLDKLLLLDPNKRIDADTALNDDFFWTDPMPCDLGKLMSQVISSRVQYTNRILNLF